MYSGYFTDPEGNGWEIVVIPVRLAVRAPESNPADKAAQLAYRP